MTESGRKVLGVLGGVGPLATAYFMEVIIRMTDAATDQEHIEMAVLNHTEIPDRTAYILDPSQPDPIAPMVRDAKRLEALGADVLATPCNTAHYFYDAMAGAVGIPFLNMIEETAQALAELGVRRAGVMATEGTVHTGLFQQALEKRGILAVLPSAGKQKYVMEIIYDNIKAGRPADEEKLRAVTEALRASGCDRIILGCTELSVLKRDCRLGEYYVDSLEVLAARAITACGGKVRRLP